MKKLQKEIKEFCEKNGLESPVEHKMLDCISELGEAAKEILKMSDYGRKPFKADKKIKTELGDVLYSLITIANTFNIDMEGALKLALKKYAKRLKRGSAGSENE